MRILVWHAHGPWTGSLVRGHHQYLLPVSRGGRQWGRDGCGRDWPDRSGWPDNAMEIPVDRLSDTDVDVVVLQRPAELELTYRWLGRRPGRDVPAVYVEHDPPTGDVPTSRHPLADRDDIVLVHVTHVNDLMWDSGRAPTVVIEHGIVDPGYQYTGECPNAGVVVNDPVRRWRATGTDLLPAFATAARLDVFGMGLGELAGAVGLDGDRLGIQGDVDRNERHRRLARRRVYLHTERWTSPGPSLPEAMHLGMPVVAVATAATSVVPAQAGFLSADVVELVACLRHLIDDPATATRMGRHAREFALRTHGIDVFLHDWDALLAKVAP